MMKRPNGRVRLTVRDMPELATPKFGYCFPERYRILTWLQSTPSAHAPWLHSPWNLSTKVARVIAIPDMNVARPAVTDLSLYLDGEANLNSIAELRIRCPYSAGRLREALANFEANIDFYEELCEALTAPLASSEEEFTAISAGFHETFGATSRGFHEKVEPLVVGSLERAARDCRTRLYTFHLLQISTPNQTAGREEMEERFAAIKDSIERAKGPIITYSYPKIQEKDLWRLKALLECVASADRFELGAQLGDLLGSFNVYATSAPIELAETNVTGWLRDKGKPVFDGNKVADKAMLLGVAGGRASAISLRDNALAAGITPERAIIGYVEHGGLDAVCAVLYPIDKSELYTVIERKLLEGV
jgi:hypothetical protein